MEKVKVASPVNEESRRKGSISPQNVKSPTLTKPSMQSQSKAATKPHADQPPKSPTKNVPIVASKIFNQKPKRTKTNPSDSRRVKTPASLSPSSSVSPSANSRDSPGLYRISPSQTALFDRPNSVVFRESDMSQSESHSPIQRSISSRQGFLTKNKKIVSKNSLQIATEKLQQNLEKNEETNLAKASTEYISAPNSSRLRQERIAKVKEVSKNYITSKSPVERLQLEIETVKQLINEASDVQKDYFQTSPSQLLSNQPPNQNQTNPLQTNKRANEKQELSQVRGTSSPPPNSGDENKGLTKRVSFYKTKIVEHQKSTQPDFKKPQVQNDDAAEDKKKAKNSIYKTFTKSKFTKVESIQKLSNETFSKHEKAQSTNKAVTKEPMKNNNFVRDNSHASVKNNSSKGPPKMSLTQNQTRGLGISKNTNNQKRMTNTKLLASDPRLNTKSSNMIPVNNNNPFEEDPPEDDEENLGEAATEESLGEAATDENLAEEAVEENLAEEAGSEENLAEEAGTEENLAEEAGTEENLAEEAGTEENLAEEAGTEENLAEEAGTEENLAEEAGTEENLAEEAGTEENLAEEAGTEENLAEEAGIEENVEEAVEPEPIKMASKPLKSAASLKAEKKEISQKSLPKKSGSQKVKSEACKSVDDKESKKKVEGISIFEIDKKRQYIKLKNNLTNAIPMGDKVIIQRYNESIYTAYLLPSIWLQPNDILTVWSKEANDQVNKPPLDIVNCNQTYWACAGSTTETVVVPFDFHMFAYFTTKSTRSKATKEMDKCDQLMENIKKKPDFKTRTSNASASKIVKSFDMALLCQDSDDDLLNPCNICLCSKPIQQCELFCESSSDMKRKKEAFDCDAFCQKLKKRKSKIDDDDSTCDLSKCRKAKKKTKRGFCQDDYINDSDDNSGDDEWKGCDSSPKRKSSQKSRNKKNQSSDDEMDCLNFESKAKKGCCGDHKSSKKRQKKKYCNDDEDDEEDCGGFSKSNKLQSSLGKPSKSIEECVKLLKDTKKMISNDDLDFKSFKRGSFCGGAEEEEEEDECYRKCRTKKKKSRYDARDECARLCASVKKKNAVSYDSDESLGCQMPKTKKFSNRKCDFGRSTSDRDEYNMDKFMQCSSESSDEDDDCGWGKCKNKGRHNKKKNKSEKTDKIYGYDENDKVCDCKELLKNKNKLDKEFCDEFKERKEEKPCKTNRCASIDFDFSNDSFKIRAPNCNWDDDEDSCESLEAKSKKKKKKKKDKDCACCSKKFNKSSTKNLSNNRKFSSSTSIKAPESDDSDMDAKEEALSSAAEGDTNYEDKKTERCSPVKKGILKKSNRDLEFESDRGPESNTSGNDYGDVNDDNLEDLSNKHRISEDFFDTSIKSKGTQNYRVMDKLKYLRELRDINDNNSSIKQTMANVTNHSKNLLSPKCNNDCQSLHNENKNIWTKVYETLIGEKSYQ